MDSHVVAQMTSFHGLRLAVCVSYVKDNQVYKSENFLLLLFQKSKNGDPLETKYP